MNLDVLVDEFASTPSDYSKYEIALQVADELESGGSVYLGNSLMYYEHWLVEAYVQASEGGYADRARRVARRLADWAESGGSVYLNNSLMYRDDWLNLANQ